MGGSQKSSDHFIHLFILKMGQLNSAGGTNRITGPAPRAQVPAGLDQGRALGVGQVFRAPALLAGGRGCVLHLISSHSHSP